MYRVLWTKRAQHRTPDLSTHEAKFSANQDIKTQLDLRVLFVLTLLDLRAIIGSRSELDLRYYELDYELDVRVLFVLTTRSAGAIIGTGNSTRSLNQIFVRDFLSLYYEVYVSTKYVTELELSHARLHTREIHLIICRHTHAL